MESSQLINKITKSSKMDGSYIITGPAGVGKMEFVLELVKTIIPKESISSNLYKVEPELTETKKIKKEREITVSQIREAIHFMSLSSAGKKICLIQKAEKMNDEAQNALLKNLEEPKKGNLFFFLVENEKKLLPTIRSRSILIKLGLTKPELIMEQLISQGIAKEISQKAAFYSGGRFLVAKKIALSEKVRTEFDQNHLDLKLLIEAPLWERFNFLEKKAESLEFQSIVDSWITILNAYLEGRVLIEEKKELTINCTRTEIAKLLGDLLLLREKIKYSNASPRLAIEAAFLEI